MSSTKGLIDPKKLTDFSARALQKVGVPEEHAKITAGLLVKTDLMGIDSHGVAHLANFYVAWIKAGAIKVNPDMKLASKAPTTGILDADEGLGFVAGYKAMNEAMDRAEKYGSGFISVVNSTHFGAASVYSTMALERDMIGISMTQGGKGIIAPGGKGEGIGLNVLSWAIPTKNEAPFILDMCTGVVAGGKIEIAARTGQPLPEGWALKADGTPATAPDEVAGILPLGGTPVLGAYKGFGLTVLVDILCSTLSGGLTVPEITEPKDGDSNHFFGAIKIDGFMSADTFKEKMDAMAKAYHNLPKASGVEKITLPGEIEKQKTQERSKGLSLHPQVVESLVNLAKELGIEYDL
ncbi:MAG: Ldh family oxidoreductase [Spirochaetales bacterium]|nr:Ldh family oxidoreductase [Spirochaetales bacterium]